MCTRILSASVSVQEGAPLLEFQFHSGINILWGRNTEAVVLTMAGMLGGIPPKDAKAKLLWHDGAALSVSAIGGVCFVDKVQISHGDSAQLAKDFHKQRFLNFRNNTHLLDGSRLPNGFAGVGNLLLKILRVNLAKEDDGPLFICNFLERLDEAVELRPIFEALLATGRQVFIAVPHYYEIKVLEEMPYVTTIRPL